VNVVQTRRVSPVPRWTRVKGRAGRRRFIRRRSSSRAPVGKTVSNVRKRPEKGDALPRATKSRNCGDRAETWFTMRSAITSAVSVNARTSSQVPRRGSTVVWSTGSNPASAPSMGVKKGRT
jgi:hypothetical protein